MVVRVRRGWLGGGEKWVGIKVVKQVVCNVIYVWEEDSVLLGSPIDPLCINIPWAGDGPHPLGACWVVCVCVYIRWGG